MLCALEVCLLQFQGRDFWFLVKLETATQVMQPHFLYFVTCTSTHRNTSAWITNQRECTLCQMWSVIPEIPIVTQLVKEFLGFYANPRFATLHESLPNLGPVYHYTTCWLYSEKLLAPCPSPKLKGHLLQVSLNLLHIFAAVLVCHGDRWSAQLL